MIHRTAAIGGLALGLLIAISANLTYAIPRGPVVTGLGLIAPLVLPVALYIRSTFTVRGFWPCFCREMATIAVAGPAAAVSYAHTYQLVLSVGEPWIIAVVAPLSSDGLAGMSTLALHRLRRRSPRMTFEQRVALLVAVAQLAATGLKSRTAPKPRPRRRPAAPPPDDAETELSAAKSKREERKQWARDRWPVTTRQIVDEFGCSRSEADRNRKDVEAEMGAAS